MSTNLTVADKHDTVIDFSIAVAAVEEVFSKHATLVGSKHAVGENRDGDRLILEQLSQLLVVASIVLNIADVLHIDYLICSIFTSVARFFSLAVLVVVVLAKNSELRDVGKALVHPSTSAAVVISVAVQKLLYRVFLKLFVNSSNFGQALNC